MRRTACYFLHNKIHNIFIESHTRYQLIYCIRISACWRYLLEFQFYMLYLLLKNYYLLCKTDKLYTLFHKISFKINNQNERQ